LIYIIYMYFINTHDKPGMHARHYSLEFYA